MITSFKFLDSYPVAATHFWGVQGFGGSWFTDRTAKACLKWARPSKHVFFRSCVIALLS